MEQELAQAGLKTTTTTPPPPPPPPPETEVGVYLCQQN